MLDRKVPVFDWKVLMFDWEVLMFDWKVPVFDWKVPVLDMRSFKPAVPTSTLSPTRWASSRKARWVRRSQSVCRRTWLKAWEYRCFEGW
jgi:hypothetical protein